MNLKALPWVFQMLLWGLCPDAAGHHCLPVPGALRFPLLTPGGSRLVVPAVFLEGPERQDRGERVGPAKESGSAGGFYLGYFTWILNPRFCCHTFFVVTCPCPGFLLSPSEQAGHCSLTLVAGRVGRGASLLVTSASPGPRRLHPAPRPPPAGCVASASRHDSCTCLSSVRIIHYLPPRAGRKTR